MSHLAAIFTALVAVHLAHGAPHRLRDGAIDLSGCGKTKGCVVSPANCQAAQCDYIYTHQWDSQANMVHFEMSAMTAGWVAVGFNDAKQMPGADVLACQLTPDHQKVVAKNLHNVNHTNALDQPGQASPFITNAQGSFADGRITCSFSRPTKTSDTKNDMDLSQRHFLLFAISSNGTAAADAALTYPHTQHPKISYGVYSAADNMFLNSSSIPIDMSTCGKAKGCSRYPPGCASPEECFYVYTQQQLPGDMVAFEASAMVHGWLAVGFNDVQGMNGTDVLACQASPKQHGGVFVKNLHNVNTSNLLDDPDMVDPYIEDPMGWMLEQHIVCKFSRAFTTKSPQFDRDLSKPHYMIFTANVNGTAPSNTALEHKHNIEPVITPQIHTATEVFNINGTTTREFHEKRRQHARAHWRH